MSKRSRPRTAAALDRRRRRHVRRTAWSRAKLRLLSVLVRFYDARPDPAGGRRFIGSHGERMTIHVTSPTNATVTVIPLAYAPVIKATIGFVNPELR